ncbi:DevR family CRISPR-associated autoregulator [Thermofilum pendens]
MVFVSMGFRFRVEVEALNMVESLGATTRHRTISVLKSLKQGHYRIVLAPAVSGQSLSNAYQRALVTLAGMRGLPVCDECKAFEKKGGFVKHATDENVSDGDNLVKSCVNEDVTGFLLPAEKGKVKNPRRTSAVMFSYLVPDVDSAGVAIDPQFHVRYDFERMEHQPFTVESGTAVYMLRVAVDVDKVGRLSDGSALKDREERLKLAFDALLLMLEGETYGAKRARYLPISEVLGGVAAVSDPLPFMVSAPRVKDSGDNYIVSTYRRAESFVKAFSDVKQRVSLVYLDNEGVVEGELAGGDGLEVVKASTLEELVAKVKEKVLQKRQG